VVNDTIVALATPPDESAISIARLSGPDALAIAASRFRGRISPAGSASHRILFGRFLSSHGSVLDTVLVSVFHAPRSYTGEDLVEISCHGGSVIPRAVVASLIEAGAPRGRRVPSAFRKRQVDLAQAESVAALIRARSDRALRAAREGLGGSLSRRIAALDAELVPLLAEVEARIDFPGDVGEAVDGAELARRCSALVATLRGWIDRLPSARRAQPACARLWLRGQCGQESLLNACRHDRAIAPEPGYDAGRREKPPD
jgi:tRNA modification GTPase